MCPDTVALAERAAPSEGLAELEMAIVRIDGERHSLVWIHDIERTVSVLVDRPNEGTEKVRVVGHFGPDESVTAIETLIADYREHHVERAASERISPRVIEPDDLIAPDSLAGRLRDG